MAQAKYYSPRLDRDLISPLYHRAQAERIPMTTLASRLLRSSLRDADGELRCVVAEDPPAVDLSKSGK